MTINVIEFEYVIFTCFETVEYHSSFGSCWSQKLMIYISCLDVVVMVVMPVAMIIMTVVAMVSMVVVTMIIVASTSKRSDWSSKQSHS